MSSDSQSKIYIGLLVVVVLGLAYFLWTKTAPPTPTVRPGQSLQNPYGNEPMGPSSTRVRRALGAPGPGR